MPRAAQAGSAFGPVAQVPIAATWWRTIGANGRENTATAGTEHSPIRSTGGPGTARRQGRPRRRGRCVTSSIPCPKVYITYSGLLRGDNRPHIRDVREGLGAERQDVQPTPFSAIRTRITASRTQGNGVIGMVTHRTPKLSLIFSGILIASTMVLTNAGLADWSGVPTDKQQINMQVPGMEHWTPGYWKEVDEETPSNRGTAYYTKWRLKNKYGIHAYLTYQTRLRRFQYTTLKYRIRFRFGKDLRSFDGDIKTYDSTIGEFEYIHLSAMSGKIKRKCVGFTLMFAWNTKLIYGHYCLSGDEPVDKDVVGPLIDSINLDFDFEQEKSTKEYTSSISEVQRDDMIIALGLTLPKLIERAEHSSIAQLELGKAYEVGRGVPNDLIVAQSWYMKAAEGGQGDAQYKIGGMYETGLGGLPIDTAKAKYWYKKSADQGLAVASSALSRLEKTNTKMGASSGLSDAQISEKLRLVKEWVDKGLISEQEAAERRKLLLDQVVAP